MYITGKCSKSIHALAKSANWAGDQTTKHRIQRGHFASRAARRADMDRGNGNEMQQNLI